MRHQPDIRWCELIIGTREGPGVGSWFVVDVDGEDGVGNASRGGNDCLMERVQSGSYTLSRDQP